MDSIQVLAVLALVSMSVPAALAVMFWRERNDALFQLDMLEHNYRTMVELRNFYRDERNKYMFQLDLVASPDDTSQWDWQ